MSETYGTYGYDQAKAQYEEIEAVIKAYNIDWDEYDDLLYADCDGLSEEDQARLEYLTEAANDYGDRDEVERAIFETPLSVEFRSGWTSDRHEAAQIEQYKIVLCCGGPHVEIRGDMGTYGPENARIYYASVSGSGEYADTDDEVLMQFVDIIIG